MTPFPSPAVQEKFAGYPVAERRRLLSMRETIFEVAAGTEGVGLIEETLKWGQPSYLTPATKSGTTVRIDAHPGGGVAIYVNCQTDLVDTFRGHYPALLYEGTRCVRSPAEAPIPEAHLRHIIALALTYHARKRSRKAQARLQASGS
jgi:hypothetical protein